MHVIINNNCFNEECQMLPGRRQIFDRSRLQQHDRAGAQLQGGEDKAPRLGFFGSWLFFTVFVDSTNISTNIKVVLQRPKGGEGKPLICW